LDFKKLEPFKILKIMRPVNYKLKLLKNFKLYLIFYIFILKPIKENLFLIINIELQLKSDQKKV
jgi:hypothetical protein